MPQLLQDISEVSTAIGSIEKPSEKLSQRAYLTHHYTKSSPKSGPCPVCGTCKWEVGKSAVFCKGTNESDVYVDNGDGTEWVAVRESNSWSGFKAYKLSEKFGASTKTRAERDAEIAYNSAQQAKETELRIASLPSLELRNAHYRTNLRPLESVDIADLIKRGLRPEEISNAERLGAIGRGPSQTRKSGRDYLVLSQVRKLIVGGQVASSGKVKYYWDNTFPTHLPETDCNPHFEFAALRKNPITKFTLGIVVEGFLKALILQIMAEREGLDWIVLGYAGGGGVNANLTIALDQYRAQYGCRFVLSPDADVHTNPDVKAAVARSLKAASYDGVLWFGQTTKGVNLDDVTEQERTQATVLSVAEYWTTIQELIDGQIEANPQAVAVSADKAQSPKSKKALKTEALATRKKAKADLILYKSGDSEAAKKVWFQNYTGIVLDKTPTGGGKSYLAAQVMAEMSVDALFTLMISNRYLRDDAIKNIVKIYGRHMGHAVVDDSVRTVRSGEDLATMTIVRDSNCFKSEQISQQIQSGLYVGDDKTIFQNDCLGCPLFKQCQNGSGTTEDGRGFGYLHQRGKLGKEFAVALHPQSLPKHDSEFYQAKIHVFIDEWDSIESRLFDVQTLTADRLSKLDSMTIAGGLNTSTSKILGEISRLGLASKFGVNHAELIEVLKTIDLDSLSEIEAAINDEQSYAKREDFDSKDAWQTQLDRLIPEFASNLRQIVEGVGTVKVSATGDIAFTCPSMLALVLRNMNIVILDATVSKEQVQAAFGGAEVTVVSSDMEVKDPKVIKINGAKYTRNRNGGMRETAIATIEAIKAAHNKRGETIAVVDSVYFLKDYKGVDCIKMGAFSESRGSNKAANAHALVMVGQVRPNMTETRNTYDLLVQQGLGMSWEEFYKTKTNEEMTQSFGRLRSNRRTNEELTVYVMDGSYEGHYDAEMTIEELINEKATGKAKKIWLIAQALKAIGSNGTDGKTTLRELEAATGVSHSHINSLLPFAATLLSALSLDELLDSLHDHGVSESEIVAIINEAILSASGADQDCVTEWNYEVEDDYEDF